MVTYFPHNATYLLVPKIFICRIAFIPWQLRIKVKSGKGDFLRECQDSYAYYDLVRVEDEQYGWG